MAARVPFEVRGNGWIPSFEKRSHPTGGGGSFTSGPPKIVWHTFEGFEGNIDGAVQFLFGRRSGVYHVLADPWQRRAVQLNGLTIAASSLRNGRHPVQTNRDGAIQICLTGYARGMRILSAGQLQWLGEAVLRPILETVPGINANHILTFLDEHAGIPLATSKSPIRITEAAWDGFDGQCGHQHVPDSNDHWDPGALNVAAITRAALGAEPAAPAAPLPRHAQLLPGDVLARNAERRSASGQYRLVFQPDGNLVLYGPRGAVWSTGTHGTGADRAVMQTDGNLVVYRGAKAVWHSQTYGNAGAMCAVQDDGNVVIYGPQAALWDARKGLLRPAAPARTYTVQSGDSLGVIARRYRTTVAELQRLNGLTNPNLIVVGQVLRLPGAGS